jgi:tRNA threonylcarbamoyladenosine biosynthesis protein TsaB
VIVLGFDTATGSTAVGLRLSDARTLQARDDPGPGEHPGHATRLLPMTGELLAGAGVRWSEIERVAVGLGPGTFTGLRIGIATARGLAQSLSVELVGVSSLRALAQVAAADRERRGVLAVIDARRGQVFVAAYRAVERTWLSELAPARAVFPGELGSVLMQVEELGDGDGKGWLGVGDGAIRFRGHLELCGLEVPPDSSPLHGVDAGAICDLARWVPAGSYGEVVPDYGRRPDAEIVREGLGVSEGLRP